MVNMCFDPGIWDPFFGKCNNSTDWNSQEYDLCFDIRLFAEYSS